MLSACRDKYFSELLVWSSHRENHGIWSARDGIIPSRLKQEMSPEVLNAVEGSHKSDSLFLELKHCQVIREVLAS
jgi:hypothetical protein